ncbi:retinitis pigmentosa 1-like 1 protein, partial [Conger conger]|uniref:retinitis pigmentosa 1-like 1 protein n=1 Tax=Conger conger TaxID=82655 RepID=UPI002A5A6D66
SSTPAKRVTFFRSGDAQFAGVRMAIHRRRFQCFEALLDDLSRKVPLQFGVRTVTTPRGTHRISELEQLQDGGRYLCSDRRYAKPVDMEAAGKGPALWSHGQPQGGRRKPSRPEGAPAPSAARYSRQPKRVVLVKNTDPAMRRSITISRHAARSLRAFMGQASQLLSCSVHKLYTLDGHKIDSVQALMQCPSVLVCVGREPFRPLLVESLRKSSDEKLPGLRNKSRSSVFSESQESKKHDNFGLETKKSIIHPRSDSSNRSTRFSLSSEKSYTNGLNTSPGSSGGTGSCPHAKGRLMNDDIEKRVVVNEDGSLSVQMRVRFRLLNDETLQWSTEIKKSAFRSEGCLGKDQDPCGLQQEQSQSFSGPESASGCEAEGTYATNQEVSRGQNCCNHCPEYDIWKHPVHGDAPPPRPARSSSSSTSSHKIVRKKESVESMRTVSCSSEEYTERVVERTTCIQHTAEGRDTSVEYCSISCCCSHRETCPLSPRPRGETGQETHRSPRPDSTGSVSSHKEQVSVQVNGVAEIEERPVSATSNSSKILEALGEDQGDDDENNEEEDLLLSASGRSCKHLAVDNQKVHPARPPEETSETCKSSRDVRSNCSAGSASPVIHLTPRPPSKESNCSGCSSKSRKSHKPTSPDPDALPHEVEQDNDKEKRTKSGASSRQSCDAQGSPKRASNTSEHSCCVRVPPTGLEGSGQPAAGVAEGRPISQISTGSPVCLHCDGGKGATVTQASEAPSQIAMEEMVGEVDPRSVSAASARTSASAQSTESNRSECATDKPASEISGNAHKGDKEQEEAEPADRAASAGSFKSRASDQSGKSHRSVSSASSRSVTGMMSSVCPGEVQSERKAISAVSDKTATSAQPDSEHNGSGARLLKSEDTNGHIADDIAGSVEERGASAVSTKSHTSAQFRSSERPLTPTGVSRDNRVRVEEDLNGKRPDSTTSSCTNVSANSRRSNCSQGDLPERAVTPASAAKAGETVEKAASGISNCTKSSVRSKASTKLSAKLDNTNCEDTERAPSVASAKSHSSAVSRKSNRSEGPAPAVAELNGDIGPLRPEERAARVLSSRSKAAVRSSSSSKLIHNSQEETSDRASTPATPGPDWEEVHKADSTFSAASGRSQKSRKCCCVASERDGTPESEADKVARAVSEKVPASQHSDSERLATPKSTVSISIGAVEEQAANDAEERVRSGMSVRSLASARSTKSKGQAKRTTPKVPVLPMPINPEDSPQQAGTPASLEIASGSETEAASIKSTSTKNSKKRKSENYLHVHNNRTSSAMSKASSRKSRSKHSRPVGKSSGAAENAGSLPSEGESAVDALTDEDVSSVGSRNSRSSDIGDGTRPISKASARSGMSKSSTKNHRITASDMRPKSSQSKAASHLQVNGQAVKPESINGSVRSVKTKSGKKAPINNLKVEVTSRSNSASSQDCLSPSPPKQRSHKHKGSVVLLGTSGDSTLSNSHSAADLLRKNSRQALGKPKSCASESTHNGAPEVTDCGKHASDSKSEKSCKPRARKGSRSSQQKLEDDVSELLPSSLPDTSPIEVVSEWLKKIPSDSSIYEMGDNFEECCKGKEADEGQKEPGQLTNDIPDDDQADEGGEQQQQSAAATEEIKVDINTEQAAEPENPDTTDMPPSPGSKCLIPDSFPNDRHSSVQVMKVLLSSKLDRCNSLPEVSPVYGRKLSSSAKGLLDCLAQLQLVGSDPVDMKAKSAKYQEVMGILQSLWLSDPLDCQQTMQKSQLKEHKPDEEYNPRSSSGVDVGGSSGESGKSVGTVDQAQKLEAAHGRITPVLEQDSQQEATEVSQHAPADTSNPVTPDIACRVRGTPGGAETDTEKEQQDEEVGLASEQTIRSNESPLDAIETPSSSNKSSGNDSNPEKSPTETNPQETSSGTPPSVQRAQLARKAQDPDPVWVLSLLQKLEKQFMAHYVTAMAEFKVRWDLDESVLLDTMINELKDEVHKRIQSSISQELRKIRGRAGRGPRPPAQAASRESSLQTEQRRRRLKGMRNKSVFSSHARSEENLTASVPYSDQRSEDEFCPCDACMRKKTAARSVPPEFVTPLPMMKDFDLRKILQRKQDPPQQEALAGNDGEDEHLEVVEEKVEEEIESERGDGQKKVFEPEETAGVNITEEGEGEEHVVEQGGDEGEDIVEAGETDAGGTGAGEGEDIVEAEETDAGGTGAGEDEDIVEAGETDAGGTGAGEGTGDGETVEDSKEDEEDGGDEGCAAGDSINEGEAENEQNKEGERETDDENQELGNKAAEELCRTGAGDTEEQRATGGGDERAADRGDSGTEAQDEQGRVESKVEEHEEGKQSNEEEDRKQRCGDEDDAIEERDGADNINSGCEEETDFKNHPLRQITKTSMESQQGSMDNCPDLEPEENTDDTRCSHGNSKARSNCMHPASSEEGATD